MDIYFLRHASAGEHLPDPKKDEKRPLDADGVKQSRRMGRVLSTLKVEFDAIISSPLTRAKETAALAAKTIGYPNSIFLDNALRPDATFDQFTDLLRRSAKRKVIMVVGHNPNLSEFLSLMVTDEATDSNIELKKGALAKLEYKSGHSLLHWILTPKMAKAVQDASASRSRPKTSRK